MPPKKKDKKSMEAEVDPNDEILVNKTALQLLQIKRRIEEIKAAQLKQLVPFRAMEAKLDGRLTAWMDANGVQSVKTDEGILTIKSTPSASVANDPDAFMTFVIENERFELMDRRANAYACLDFADETGKLPPGVKITVTRKLLVKEPK